MKPPQGMPARQIIEKFKGNITTYQLFNSNNPKEKEKILLHT